MNSATDACNNITTHDPSDSSLGWHNKNSIESPRIPFWGPGCSTTVDPCPSNWHSNFEVIFFTHSQSSVEYEIRRVSCACCSLYMHIFVGQNSTAPSYVERTESFSGPARFVYTAGVGHIGGVEGLTRLWNVITFKRAKNIQIEPTTVGQKMLKRMSEIQSKRISVESFLFYKWWCTYAHFLITEK